MSYHHRRLIAVLVFLLVVLAVALAVPLFNRYQQATARQTTAAYGRTLFQAKGCASCHHHDQIPNSGQYQAGWLRDGQAQLTLGAPDLSAYPVNPPALRAWLQNPQSVRPQTPMPNLGLHPDEITALIAFLSTTQPQP